MVIDRNDILKLLISSEKELETWEGDGIYIYIYSRK